MKTAPTSSLRATTTAAGALLLGVLAVSAFAGLGPQHCTARRPASPADSSAAACADGATTTTFQHGDRGPARKGVGRPVAVIRHTCGSCAGSIITEGNASTTG